VAVVLNANARRVDTETLRWVQTVVPPEDLFLSRSIADGAGIADELIVRRYDVVLWGGGDGTFVAGVQALYQAAAVRGSARIPQVGVLRLGTGNAMAEALGAGPSTADGLAEDLRRARSQVPRREVRMLEVEGKPTVFCGFGIDAQILDDFGATVGMLRRAKLDQTVKSAGLRYFLSVASRSLPRFMLSQRAEIVAVNRGSDAVRVDAQGNMIGKPIPAGRVLWRGQATMASAASIPYYGLSMRMFPHADGTVGRFQLRMSDMGTAEALANLQKIWKGECDSPRLFDFLVDRIELIVSRPAPFQSGGDLIGSRQAVTIGMWDRPVAVV
jgi:diacylglycerol kinase family enzyme